MSGYMIKPKSPYKLKEGAASKLTNQAANIASRKLLDKATDKAKAARGMVPKAPSGATPKPTPTKKANELSGRGPQKGITTGPKALENVLQGEVLPKSARSSKEDIIDAEIVPDKKGIASGKKPVKALTSKPSKSSVAKKPAGKPAPATPKAPKALSAPKSKPTPKPKKKPGK